MKGQCLIFHLLSRLYGGLTAVYTTGSPSYQQVLLLSSAESRYHRTVLCVCVCVLHRSAENRSQQLGETAPTGGVPGRMCFVSVFRTQQRAGLVFAITHYYYYFYYYYYYKRQHKPL